MVDSCMTCSRCKCKEEQYCATGSVFTYGGKTKYGRAGPDGVATAGGYSDKMVVHEHFGIKVPDGTPLEKAAPLLCAGYVHLICPYLCAAGESVLPTACYVCTHTNAHAHPYT